MRLAAGESRGAWDALLGEVGQERALALLDLVSVVSLKARTTGGVVTFSRTVADLPPRTTPLSRSYTSRSSRRHRYGRCRAIEYHPRNATAPIVTAMTR